MKRAVVITLLACWAASALSLAGDEKGPMPPATMSSAKEFNPNPSPTPPKTTTTTTAKTTTTTTVKTTTTTTPKTTTTTTVKTTTTTTPKTTTTTPPPPPPKTTTTTPPKTTTTTPPPPPPKTTTTTPPKTTTTTPPPPPPKTTTTPPPPPPQPTPPTTLRVGNYSLMSGKAICLMAQMTLQIRLDQKSNGPFIVQPNLTTVQGGCDMTKAKANLTIVFKEGFITFMFNKSTDENTVYVDALSFVISYPLSKENKMQYSANNKSLHLFAAKVGHSYSCRAESLYMGNGLYLDVNQDRMQAFNLTASNEFGSPDTCAADKPDYRVAIAVGVTLLVLIIIVVVAYLLGRRRRTDGYQTL